MSNPRLFHFLCIFPEKIATCCELFDITVYFSNNYQMWGQTSLAFVFICLSAFTQAMPLTTTALRAYTCFMRMYLGLH